MTADYRTNDEAEIRELTASWTKTVCTRNVNAVMSHYAPEILLFDLAPPLQYAGGDAYRKNWEEWFATWQGRIGYEIEDLHQSEPDQRNRRRTSATGSRRSCAHRKGVYAPRSKDRAGRDLSAA